MPDTVNRVIMSRIDRLDESSRNVLRVASVIGKEFQQWLLNAIYPYRQTEDGTATSSWTSWRSERFWKARTGSLVPFPPRA